MSRSPRLLLRVWPVLLAAVSCASAATVNPYVLPDEELMDSEFKQISGYGGASTSTLNSRTDVSGSGVQFNMTLSGANNGKIGIGDSWPTSANAGLGWDPVQKHYTSLANFDGYQMTIQYVSGPVGSEVNVSLIMNTGLTGPSGFPNWNQEEKDFSGDKSNDTFWAGAWVTIGVGETKTLTLDFSSAEAWNITDNKDPHTGGGLGLPNGGWYAINDRDQNEITNIGLQIADFDGDVLGQSATLHLNAQPVPAPAGLALLSLGSGLVVLIRRRRKGGRLEA
jgi:hypothetical protein